MHEVGIAQCRLVAFAHNEQSASAAILDRSKIAEAYVIRLISATLRASGAVAYVLIVVLMSWWPS